MTSIHYCATVSQSNRFTTYGFDCPADLVRFLAQPPFPIIQITHLFEIPYQHPVYLGILSSEEDPRPDLAP